MLRALIMLQQGHCELYLHIFLESCARIVYSGFTELVESWPAILLGRTILALPTYSSTTVTKEEHAHIELRKEKAAQFWTALFKL